VCACQSRIILWGKAHQNPSKNLSNQQKFLTLFVSLPFDDSAAEHYGRIRSELARAGTPIGGNDVMIAAIALTHNLTLVTHNLKEFERVNGLKIEDWEASSFPE
jgi:tRNA(fMet)-specific endonuclease VapC